MMKRLSKITLLAAASAFMLAVFPACGGEEEPESKAPVVKATLTGDAVTLEVGTPKPIEATVTVTNDTFSDGARTIQKGGKISTDNFLLRAGENVTLSEATLEEWTSDTVAKISFTVTAEEGAADGTISADIKKGTLTNTDSLTTTGNIAYTIKKEGGAEDDKPGQSTVNAVWTFKGVTFGEGTMAGLTSGSKLSDDVELAATSGTGATLSAVSQSAFKEDNTNKRGLKTDATKKFTAIADVKFDVKGIGSSTSEGPIKGALKLVLSADATVVLKGLISGSSDLRYLLLADADAQILEIVPETKGNTADQTIEKSLTAGTYYIGLDGFILASVECK